MIIIDCSVAAVLLIVALFIYAETRGTSPGAPGQSAQSYALEGVTAFKAGEFSLAQKLFADEIHASGKSANARAIGLYNLGTALARLNHVNLAIGDYQLAVKYVPNFSRAWITLASTEASLRNDALALTDYNDYLAIDPSNPLALLNSGVLLYDGGQKIDGVMRIKKALSLEHSLSSQVPTSINLN